MKAIQLRFAHGADDTLNTLVFDNGIKVYFAEDDTAVVEDPGHPDGLIEWVEGEYPSVDYYIGEGSDPSLLYYVPSYEMTQEETAQVRSILNGD